MPRPLRSPKKQDDRRQRRWRRFIFAGVFSLFALIGLTMLSRLDSLTIRSVEIARESVTTARDLQAVADEVLDGNWLLLFPKRNGLLYPEAQLRAAVLAAFPRISAVEIERPNAQTLVLSLKEREPYALWCEGSARENSRETCFFLDQEGVIFARAPEFSGTGYFIYYGPLLAGGSENPIGSHVMEAGQFRQIAEFLDVLGTFADKPAAFSILENNNDYEVELAGGTRILFSREADLTNTLENIRSVLTSDAIKEATAHGKELDSIDVRFGNRVYYRLK